MLHNRTHFQNLSSTGLFNDLNCLFYFSYVIPSIEHPPSVIICHNFNTNVQSIDIGNNQYGKKENMEKGEIYLCCIIWLAQLRPCKLYHSVLQIKTDSR